MNLKKAAHDAGSQARKQAFDKGLTVFQMQGSFIVEVDGADKIISRKYVEKSSVLLPQLVVNSKSRTPHSKIKRNRFSLKTKRSRRTKLHG